MRDDPVLTPWTRLNHKRNQQQGSESSLGESGISSRGSSLDDTQPVVYSVYSTSAPSTPSVMIRRKPPPKPPRMRSYIQSGPTENGTCPSPPLSPPGDIKSLKSSLADVTNALDLSMIGSPRSAGPKRSSSPRRIQSQTTQIMHQAKEFLSYEIEPDALLVYLRQHDVFSSTTERELRRARCRHSRSELLLDIITSKGQSEFETFCEALRTIGRQPYLADVLQVLNTLIETVLQDKTKEKEPASPSKCSVCSSNNNTTSDDVCDVLDEPPNFEVDIFYVNSETGQTRAMKDVQILKLSRMYRVSGTEESILLRSEADRYVPVLAVSLFSQCLCDGKVDILADILSQYSCIRELSLAKNHIGVEGMALLGEALKKNYGLYKLDIRLNIVGDKGGAELAAGLRGNSSIRILNLTSTGLTGSGCTYLMQGLSRNNTLTDLDVGFNDLQDTGCEAVADLLANNCSLRKLRMRDNYITSDGARRIFKSLRKNSRLFYLDMSSNKVGNESIAALAEVLLFNRTLRELNLENCRISTEGCAALARALKTNTVLRSLDLSMNPMGDSGVDALSDGLKYNQVLDVLCLNMCGVGNRGFIKLLDALYFNATLTSLKLCYNNIGPARVRSGTHDCPPTVSEIYERLCQILQQNKDLKVLLWGNKLDGPDDRPSGLKACNTL